MKTRHRVLNLLGIKLTNSIFSFLSRVIYRVRPNAPRTADVRPTDVRPEVAALIERNMDERPDLWADLA